MALSLSVLRIGGTFLGDLTPARRLSLFVSAVDLDAAAFAPRVCVTISRQDDQEFPMLSCVGFVLTVGAFAGATSANRNQALTVAPSTPTGPVAPGARVTLALDVTPKRTMHVYAPEPKAAGGARTVPHGAPEGLIPVSLKIDPDPAIAVGADPVSQTRAPECAR